MFFVARTHRWPHALSAVTWSFGGVGATACSQAVAPHGFPVAHCTVATSIRVTTLTSLATCECALVGVVYCSPAPASHPPQAKAVQRGRSPKSCWSSAQKEVLTFCVCGETSAALCLLRRNDRRTLQLGGYSGDSAVA